MFCENYDQFVSELEKRNYTVHSAKDAAEAKAIALSLVGKSIVGCGGSATVSNMGLPDAMREQGCSVFFHWEHAREDKPAVLQKAATAEWYISSTNGITRKGKLVNIDGNGNRVSAMCFGPQNVMIIAGKNKFSETVEESIDRIKSVACPANGKRLNRATPCALTGRCTDCYSAQRMCNITTIIDAKPSLTKEFHLILVDEELGY